MLKDLKGFLMRGNVVDLAVAVVIGAAFKTVIDAFVEFILNPIIAAVFGEPDLTSVLNITLREGNGIDPETGLTTDTILSIGGVLDAVLSFVIIGTCLFVVVKAYEKLQARNKEEEVAEPDAPSDEVVLLTEIRDSLRTQS